MLPTSSAPNCNPNLADFDSRRQPARLNVVDVVEIEPADRQRFQIIHRRGFRNFLSERRIFRRENPRDERRKAARLFLQSPNALEMIDAMVIILAAAEHHRRRRAQAE